MRILPGLRHPILLLGAVLTVLACTDSPHVCNVACPNPGPSITVHVSNAATGAPIAFASVLLSGAANGTVPCDSAGTCVVVRPPGTYDLTIIASGYQSTQRSVFVPGTVTGGCGCYEVTAQTLSVALTPSAAGLR